MLDMPTLKFDKSIKYLESQINIQKNNKNLILDIISNIGLILNTSSKNDNTKLQSVLDKANNFLQNISNNITNLEQLNIEISNITADLNEIVSSKSKSTKTKEYYIAAFSNIKNNIIQYTQNFQELENKLDIDNNAFNDFIKDNDFKYTFNTVNNETENTYELASFSINNESTSISADIENKELSEDDIIDNGIEEAIAENEKNAEVEASIQEETTSSEVITESTKEINTTNTIEEINSAEEILIDASNNIEETNSTEDVIEETLDNSEETDSTEDVIEETLDNSEETDSTEDVIEETLDNSEEANSTKGAVDETSDNIEETDIDKFFDEDFDYDSDDVIDNIIIENNEGEVNSVEEKNDINSNLNVILNDLFDENASNIKSEKETHITSIENPKTEITKPSIDEIIKKIESATEKNKTLLISEKTNKIYLPYRISELQNYMDYYPNEYKNLSDVVEQEFIINLDTFIKHPSQTRFSETYNLVRNRSGKSRLKALSYALKLRNNGNINPAIIAACKNEYELHCYLYCLEQNKTEAFKFFNIIYDISLY